MVCFVSILQELQVEKQKTSRVEAVMREQRAAMEKELGGMQAKAQGSYQELQTMQIKVKIVCISFQFGCFIISIVLYQKTLIKYRFLKPCLTS